MVEETYKKFAEYQRARKILTGIVRVISMNPETEKEELILDCQGVKCVIPRDKIDISFNFKSLVCFIGAEVSFLIEKIDKENDVIYGSRAAAQKILNPSIIGRLKDGECFEGKILNILAYGAYVNINGVTGLLKNVDFAEDYSTIGEVHRVGDSIKVKLRGFSKNGNINFEAVNKYLSPTTVRKEDLEVGQIVTGVVDDIQAWGVFVRIAPGVDALVDCEFLDIQEDQKVSVKIKSIKNGPDKLKVRGKIVNLL